MQIKTERRELHDDMSSRMPKIEKMCHVTCWLVYEEHASLLREFQQKYNLVYLLRKVLKDFQFMAYMKSLKMSLNLAFLVFVKSSHSLQ